MQSVQGLTDVIDGELYVRCALVKNTKTRQLYLSPAIGDSRQPLKGGGQDMKRGAYPCNYLVNFAARTTSRHGQTLLAQVAK